MIIILVRNIFAFFFLCDSEFNWGGRWLLGGKGVILTAKSMRSQIFDVCKELSPQMFDE